MSVYKKTIKKVRVHWFSLLMKSVRETSDQRLLARFWCFMKTHRLTKNSAARCVLLSYYSTTPAPDFVLKHFSLKHDCKVAQDRSFYEL